MDDMKFLPTESKDIKKLSCKLHNKRMLKMIL